MALPLEGRQGVSLQMRPACFVYKAAPAVLRAQLPASVEAPPQLQPSVGDESPGTSDDESISSQARGLTPR